LRNVIKMDNVIRYIKNIKKSDDVIIIFHNDADGICSAALMLNYLSFLEKKPFIISQPMPMDKNLIQKVKTTIPNKIIFLDLAADQQYNMLLKPLSSLAKIMVIDHHKISTDLNKKNIVHYNPRFSDPDIYQSASYCVYEILSKIHKMEKYLWIAAIGIVADYALEDSEKLIKQIKKKYNIKEMRDSIFEKISDMICAANSTKSLKPENIVELIVSAKGPEEIISNNDLVHSYELVENEIKKVLEDTEKNSEIINNTLFYNLKSKFNLRSPISSKLVERYPKKNIIIYQKIGSKIKISARSNITDIASKLKESIRGLNASAGGHERAAGAILYSKDWEKFKENMAK